MTITKQVYKGVFAAQYGAAPSPYEVTCRLVTTRLGLESLHITGWVAVDGAQNELSILGITSREATMHGLEHSIAMGHIAQLCEGRTQAPG